MVKLTAETKDTFWPPLPFAEWAETAATLHMWTQIVGKIRLVLTPWTNHSWHVTLYLTSRGLTTSPIPHGLDTFEIRFDFLNHELRIVKSDGALKTMPLQPQSVAAFYRNVMSALTEMNLPVKINLVPNEIENAIPFDRDEQHRSYDAAYANRFWRVLVQADRVFKEFRGGVPHLPDAVTREAYSQEVSSLGFWPGNAAMPTPLFYSYAYPEPAGFAQAKVQPESASYNATLREFTLPYDAVRAAKAPDEALLEFAQSTYDAASILGKWDRTALEEVKPSLLSGH